MILVIDDHDLPRPPKAFSATFRGLSKGVLHGPSCPFAALRGQKEVKMFFVPLRGPSWIKKVFFMTLAIY